jgi:hypothetical protein
VVGAAAGVAVAAAAGVASLGIGVGDSAAKTPAEVNDNMIAADAIVLLNFMVDCPSLFPF